MLKVGPCNLINTWAHFCCLPFSILYIWFWWEMVLEFSKLILSGKLLKTKHYIRNTWDCHWGKAFLWFRFFKTLLTSGSIKLTIQPFNGKTLIYTTIKRISVLFWSLTASKAVCTQKVKKKSVMLKLFCHLWFLKLIFHMHM